MEKISIILLGLIFVDFLLLWKKSNNLLGKIIHRKITERENVANNLMMGLLAGFMIFSLDKGNFMIALSTIFILFFIILRGFEYKKIK